KYQRERMKNRPHDFQQWNAKFSHKVFDRLRQEHKTICTGYAYLVKELSYHAGLKAEIVHGYGRTALSNVKGEGIPNHSWNAIYLNNKWYLCDPTWSSTVVPSQSGVSIKQYDDTYFLTEPGLFILDHYPLQAQWTLVDNPPTLTQFLNGPLVYKSALDHDILPNYPNSFGLEVKKGETVTFSVLSERDLSIHAFKLQVVKNGSENTNDLLFSNVKDDLYSLSQAFNRKGRYILHFLLDSDHLFSYELHVQ
ncbi:MAG: transglutaminase domain-containing protein, partial [Bacteroidota bacterium]